MVMVLSACAHSSGKVAINAGGAVTTAAVPTTRPAAPTDPVAAEAAIRHAYDTWANPNVSEAERAAANEIITDPAEIAFAKEMSDGNLAQAANVRFVVDAIRFTSDVTADVDFHIRYGDGPSPVVPGLVPGGAVLEDGHWRVTHATGCFLDATAIGRSCPGSALTAEEQAIGQPFADLSRVDLPDDQRVAEIERGDEIRDFIVATAHRYANALGGSLTVLAVRHRPDAPDAEVWYTQGSVQPGIAVLDRGRWTVSRATWCQLTANFGGGSCPQ
jgi:hypothetical protein